MNARNRTFTRSRRSFLKLTGAGAATLALSGVARPLAHAQSTPGAAGGEVKMLIRQPVTLNPFFSTSGNEQQIERLVFGSLVKSSDQLQPTPDLAETIDAAPDGLTYTFTLHEGLVFNDGEPLTSADVVFTFQKAVLPTIGSVWQGRLQAITGAKDFAGGSADAVSGLETPDERTVVINLEAPDSTFLLTLSDYSGLAILPEHALADTPDDQWANITFLQPPFVSGGAYNLVTAAQDQYIELVRSETYTVRTPNLDRILLPVRTPDVALGEMQTGDLDIMPLPVDEIETVERMEGVSVVSVQSPMMTHIVINNLSPYLADKRIRQAMMYAIDRASILANILGGQGEITNSPIFGPDWMGIPEGLNEYPYDPDKAKALLAEMGWDPNQTIVALAVPPVESVSEIMAQQINDVGIKFELLQTDIAELIARITGPDPDFDAFMNGGDTYRADPNISALFYDSSQITPTGSNYSSYSNPALDELYVQGRSTNDLEERKRIYTEAAKMLNEDVPNIFLWSPNSFFAVNDRVQGFMGPGYVDNRLWNADEWSVTS
ncbi:MAG: twin-arginine translocation signal domain-containing protein [Thermomicrobiales bacterium]|nr:twin-arginine translocation signal domain-containing protein [Thermomicrobiales bacterium]